MQRCMHCMSKFSERENICPHCGKENTGMPVSSKHLMPGTVLNDRYIAGCAVDSNSIFVTYAAWDNESEKKVLINEYLPNNLASREKGAPEVMTRSGDYEDKYYAGLDAFSDECEDLIGLSNIDIIDGFEENNTYYVVRRLIKGGQTLAELIDGDFEIAKDYRKNIIVNIMRVIKPVHDAGIIHGNICPDTIIIKQDNSVVLTDFSFCGYMSRIIPVYTNEGYSPIEQYSVGSRLTVAVDVYSIAAVYYEMLTGEIPLSAPERQRQDTLMPPSKMNVRIRPSMENAILNALNIKAENRTATVDEFYDELKSKNTVRHWERVKQTEKPAVDFYTKKSFWLKLMIWGIVLIMAVSVIVIAAEVSAIKKRAQTDENPEVSTEKVPDEGDSFWDRFRTDSDTKDKEEPVAEKKDNEPTSEEEMANKSPVQPEDKVVSGDSADSRH